MATTFWVTTNCNLNCKYCYEGDHKLNIIMSEEIIDKAIDFTVKNSNDYEESMVIAIHGGEPFLAFDKMKYIVKRSKDKCKNIDKKLIFLTTTNATLLDEEKIKFIIEEMPDITVSIDGARETHDKNRPFKNGKGTHDIAIKNSLILLEHLPNIRVRMTFDSESVSNLYRDVKYIADLGFKFIAPAANLFDNNWSEEHVEILESQIKQIKGFTLTNHDVNISFIDKEIYKPKGHCSGGKSGFHIYPNGDIYPCILTGGIHEFCIGDIYNGVNAEKIDEILKHSSNINPECDGCKQYSFCDGPRCKIINKLVTNSYYKAPPILCAIENIKYRVNVLE